jgi:hypothetical protein
MLKRDKNICITNGSIKNGISRNKKEGRRG